MAENFDELFNVPLTEPVDVVPRSGSNTTISLDDSTASSTTDPPVEYRPLCYHWFYSSSLLDKLIWIPMSFKDSQCLENIYLEKMYSIHPSSIKPIF